MAINISFLFAIVQGANDEIYVFAWLNMGVVREIPYPRLCVNVLTELVSVHTLSAHNKQGGRGRHILPDWPWEIYGGPAVSSMAGCPNQNRSRV